MNILYCMKEFTTKLNEDEEFLTVVGNRCLMFFDPGPSLLDTGMCVFYVSFSMIKNLC